MTVAEWMAKYQAIHYNWEASTAANVDRIIRCHINPVIGDYNISDLSPTLLSEWVISSNKKLAASSVRDCVRLLRSALELAVDEGLIPKNPAKRLVLPKIDGHEPRILTEEEIKALCIALRGTDLFTPVVLAVAGGLRRGEVMGLCWGDIEGPIVRVRRSLGPHGVKEPKTRSSRRSVVLPDWAAGQVSAGRRKHKPTDPVCAGFTPGGLTMAFRRAADRLGYEGLTFHGLRHTHASVLLAHDVNIKTISKRLGHKNTNITLNVYAHLMPGMDESAAAVMDGVL